MFFPAVPSAPGHRLGLVLVSGDDRSWWQLSSGECTCGTWAIRCTDEDIVVAAFEAHVSVSNVRDRVVGGWFASRRMRTALADVVECVR